MMTPLNKQIKALRQKGLTFNQIAKKLKCSKSTVSYALRKKTRELVKARNELKPKHRRIIENKIYTFKAPKPKKHKNKLWYLNQTPRQISKSISTKASTFQKPMTFNKPRHNT